MKYLLFVSLLLLNLTVYSQQNSISWKTKNLKNKVKFYSVETFTIDDSLKVLSRKYNVKYTFNKRGDIYSIENFGTDTNRDSKETYEYKSKRVSKIMLFNTFGKKSKTSVFYYNDKGNVVSKKRYNSNKKMLDETSYLHNLKGQLTLQLKLIPSINYTMKESYIYDAKGDLTERHKTSPIGTTKEIFDYDSKGLPIKKSEYNTMGQLFSVIVYQYNEHDDKISLKKYDSDNNLDYYEDYEYSYDTHNNWTERISFEKGIKTSIEKREIKYY